MAEIGIEPHTTVHFAREQDEPLLLLPDYLAGAFHHADVRAGLTKSVAPPDDVRAVIEPFSRRHGRLLVVQDGAFDEPYPLDLEKDIVSRRRLEREHGRQPVQGEDEGALKRIGRSPRRTYTSSKCACAAETVTSATTDPEGTECTGATLLARHHVPTGWHSPAQQFTPARRSRWPANGPRQSPRCFAASFPESFPAPRA